MFPNSPLKIVWDIGKHGSGFKSFLLVLVICSCLKYYPDTTLKQQYLLSHSCSRSGIRVTPGWVFCFKLQSIKMATRRAVLIRFNWLRVHFQAHSPNCWQDLGPQFSLAVGQRLPSVPCQLDLSIAQHGLTTCHLASSEPASKKTRESCAGKRQSDLNLVLVTPSHHLCWVQFIRSRSLGSFHIQVKGIIKWHE